jgi:hypothetical protein
MLAYENAGGSTGGGVSYGPLFWLVAAVIAVKGARPRHPRDQTSEGQTVFWFASASPEPGTTDRTA